MRVDGIDISHHQQQRINYAAAKKAGLKWLAHKATEGATYSDPNYTKRRAEARSAGIPFCAYHFARPDKGDAIVEARAFIRVAKPDPSIDVKPVLDLETNEAGMSLSALRDWARTFNAEVRRLTGVLPIVYTPYDLGPVLEGCIVWRPRYNGGTAEPELPWDIWQFSDRHDFPGFGEVDVNFSKVPLSRLLMTPPAAPVVKEKDRLRVVSHNMYVGNKDPKGNLTRLAENTDADVIVVQEAKNWHGTIPGYERFVADSDRPEADSTILLVRKKDTEVHRERSIEVGGPDWIGPKHDLRHKPRVFPAASIEVRGRRWDVIGIHRNPGGPDSRNEDAWRAEDKALVEWEARREEHRPKRPAVLAGDWNDRKATKHPVSVSSLAKRLGGDLRLRGIDGAIAIGADGIHVKELPGRYGSDGHNPVVIDLWVEEER